MILAPVPVTRLRLPAGGSVPLPRDVYLSASMSRVSEMRTRARTLLRLRFRTVSSWIRAAGDERTPQGRAEAAVEDLRDLDEAGLVLAFTEPPGAYFTGGRHVELGYALAMGKRVVVIGPVENVFHDHPKVLARFRTWEEFLHALEVSHAD